MTDADVKVFLFTKPAVTKQEHFVGGNGRNCKFQKSPLG